MSDSASLVEQLQEAVYKGDLAHIRVLTDGLSEEERAAIRRPLVKSNRQLAKDLIAFTEGKSLPDDFARRESMNRVIGRTEFRRAVEAVALLLTALGNNSEVEWAIHKSHNRWRGYGFDTPARERFTFQSGMSLGHRPAAWVKDLLPDAVRSSELDANSTEPPLFLADELMSERLISLDQLVGIVVANARDYRLESLDWEAPHWRCAVNAAIQSRRDPHLDTRPFQREFGTKLRSAFASGALDRGSLLTHGIERLSEATRRESAMWWGHFVEAALPTLDDWKPRVSQVLDLLAAPTTRARGIGMEAAKKLFAVKAIMPADLISPLAIALESDAIGVARTAVELLRGCTERDRSIEALAVSAGIAALQHPKPAVTDAYLAWLESENGWREHEEVTLALTEAACGLTDASAARVCALIGAETASGNSAEDELRYLNTVKDEVRVRLSSERSPRKMALLEACLRVLDGDHVEPGTFRPLAEQSPFAGAGAYAIPETAEAAAHELLRVAVDWSHPANLEAILAVIRRPLSSADAHFAGRLLDRHLPPDLPRPATFSWDFFWRNTKLLPYGCEFARVALANSLTALKEGVASPPLSLPTHDDGRLDPRTLAERISRTNRWQDWTLFELSSALYRLIPNAALREESWTALRSSMHRLPRPVPDLLTVALGPDDQTSVAGSRLIEWAAAWGLDPFDVRRAMPLRIVCSAARARYGANVAPFLQSMRRGVIAPGVVRPGTWRIIEALADVGGRHARTALERQPTAISNSADLAATVRFFFDRPEANPNPEVEAHQEWRAWSRVPEGLFPELTLRPYAADVASAAFAFPEGIGWFLDGAAELDPPLDGGVLTPLLHVARRGHVDLRSHLRAVLTHAKREKTFIREAACMLLHIGFKDGRLRSDELIEAIAADLILPETRSGGMIAALAAIAEVDPDYRNLLAVAVERCLSSGTENSCTATERVALMERLHNWRAAAGRGVETPEARAVLQVLAEAKRPSRTRELARLLLHLPIDGHRPTASRMLAFRDVEVTLSHLYPKGESS